MSLGKEKVAIVTGGNTGIGLTLCERLLAEHKNLHLCLACRNQLKAEAAQSALQISHPDSVISIVIIDTSNVQSVYKAAEEIRTKFQHVDYLYLNAGIMPVSGINYNSLWKGLFSSNCVHMLATGSGLLYSMDDTTPEGLKQVFATNLFGHFVLIKELENNIGGPSSPTQIIWTSSSAAAREDFDIQDIQHEKGVEPYKSSKHAIDMLSVELNTRLNKQNVYSHTVCPGLVMTNLTNGILPSWVWTLMFPFIWLMRFLIPGFTYTSYNGCESLVWLSMQKPETLDPLSKFFSSCSLAGKCYVQPKQISLDVNEATKLYNQLDQLEITFSTKYKKADVVKS